MRLEQEGADRQQHRREDVGARDHRPPADGVEQPPEQQRSKEASGGERDDVVRRALGRNLEERRQQVGLSEHDRVVEERPTGEQRQPDERALGIGADDRADDLEQADRAPLADLDLARGLGQLLVGDARQDVAFDLRDDLVRLVLVPVDYQPSRTLGDGPANE